VLTWAVHELNNTDKHRMIPVTTTGSFVTYLRMFRPDRPPIDILPWQETVREPLHDGMEVARVPITEGMDDVTFEIPVGMDIAFERVGGLLRHPVTDLLSKAADHVSAIIESFRGEFA
jgi:hypothetical protein